jgi:hypothetical protein
VQEAESGAAEAAQDAAEGAGGAVQAAGASVEAAASDVSGEASQAAEAAASAAAPAAAAASAGDAHSTEEEATPEAEPGAKAPVSQAVQDLENAGDGAIGPASVTPVDQPKVKKLGQAHVALWQTLALINQVFLVLWVAGAFLDGRPYSVTGLILAVVVVLATFPAFNFFSPQTKAGIAFFGTSIALLLTAVNKLDVTLLLSSSCPLCGRWCFWRSGRTSW